MRWVEIAGVDAGPDPMNEGEAAAAKAGETRRKAVAGANKAIRAAADEADPGLALAKRSAAQARIRVANAKFQKAINK